MQGFGGDTPEDGIPITTYLAVDVPGGPVDTSNPTYVGTVAASIMVTGENTSLGQDFNWGIFGMIMLEVEGPDENGNMVGLPEGLDTGSGFAGTMQDRTFSANARLFPGATRVAITVSGARTSPALSDGSVIGNEINAQWSIPYNMYNPGPEIRNWPDYYNFYDAINDWSPKAVLEFHGPESVQFYPGTDDQKADPTMALVVPGGGEAIIADPNDPDAADDFTVAGPGEGSCV